MSKTYNKKLDYCEGNQTLLTVDYFDEVVRNIPDNVLYFYGKTYCI
jgi:hypothetical protein